MSLSGQPCVVGLHSAGAKPPFMGWCAASRRVLDASHSYGHPPLQHRARLAAELAKLIASGNTYTKLVRGVVGS